MSISSATGAHALADGPEYISEDAKVAGKVVHTFADGGQDVVVVLGGFEMKVGKRTLSGDQAVLWIKENKAGNVVRRDIAVYIKGHAKIVEANGTETGDKTILVTVHQQGKLSARGQMSTQSLIDDPLYTEALDVLKGKPAPVATTGKSTGAEPMGIDAIVPADDEPTATQIAGEPATQPTTEFATEPSATQPATEINGGGAKEPLVKVPANTPTTRPAVKTAKPAVKPAEPLAVTFRPESFSVEEMGKDKHVIVATGVYLSQGNSDSDTFMVMQAQTAAVFTAPSDKKTNPRAPQLIGMAGKSGQAGESVIGVYLEGDVRMTRGDRYMRARALYYDFANDRAIILDPVFRTIQEQRNVPIYIRAREARQLSVNEMLFKDAKVTTSDFASPEYHIGASSVDLKDITEYDDKGVQISPKKYEATMKDVTFNIYSVPLLYWPKTQGPLDEGNSSLRSASLGSQNGFGFGGQTEWDLFRLLGVMQPEGFKASLDAEVYEKGTLGAVNLDYARRLANRQYSGYDKFVGVIDNKHEDTFGRDLKDVPAPTNRYWALMRHKELLQPKEKEGLLELQFELSYLSDQNFLRKFYPNEYSAAKEQETLIYAKKQRDNWAVDTLLQTRLNKFTTQTESYPDFSFHWLGEPLAGDALSFYNEDNLGVKRFGQGENEDSFQPADGGPVYELGDSKTMVRANTRNELDAPLHPGPVNIVPYVVGQGTYWSNAIDGSSEARPYGQAGIKSNMHFQRVYGDASNRLFDVNQLRHIVTPQGVVFFSGDGGVNPDDLYPLDPGIEEHVGRINGGSFGVYQRLQTKRGPEGNQHTVDWMKLNIIASFFDTNMSTPPADGRFFLSRPEYSIPRDSINGEYVWNISDATSFMSDMNYDTKSGDIGRADAGFAISRDPRLRYYIGWRFINELNSSVGTFGVNYKLNEKYSISVFEQYDFKFHDGENLGTNISVIRKFPRWYGAFTFQFDKRTDDVALMVTFWPEGIPEFKLGGERTSLLGVSSDN